MNSLDTSLGSALADLEASGLLRGLRRQQSSPGPWADVEGRRILNLGSNNYLGLTEHPEVRKAAAEAISRWGTGGSGSRLTTGDLDLFGALEQELALFEGTEAAIIFSSGYAANLGVLPALVGRGDLILSDALNHASLIDGCRLSGAEIRIYRHGDADHARELLRDRDKARRCLLVTDGVFSMDGDLAPLSMLCDLCDETDTWLMVDDAHGTGVLGPSGRGTAEHLGVAGRVPIKMGTLSKALGAAGGFVAGSQVLIDYLRNRARSFLFSTSPGPSNAEAARAAVAVARNEPTLQARLSANSARLRSGLRGLGLDVPDGISPIIPVILGTPERAVQFSTALEENGVWAPAIRPPSVPDGTARLRVTTMASHTREDMEFALHSFAKVLRNTDLCGHN